MHHEDETELHASDMARLETSLSARARELRELRSELERRGVLIRDLAVRMEALPGTSAPVASAVGVHGAEAIEQLKAERDAAVARALEAEAAALEGRFQLDELAGHIATMPKLADAGPSGTRASETHAAELAARDGAIRGWRSRLADAEDARDRAEARLMLTEHDLDDARAQSDRHRSTCAELSERLEIEALRSRTAETRVAALRGELLGLRHAGQEAESAFQSVRKEWKAARTRAEDLRTRVSLTVAERDAFRGALDSARTERDDVSVQLSEQRAKVTALRHEISEREADLASVRAGQDAGGAANDRSEAFQNALLETRQDLHDLGAWLGGEAEQVHLAGTTSFELEAPLGSSNRPPRDDETLPGVPLHVQAMAAVETMAVEALEEQLARKDDQLRALEARLDELLQQGR